MKRREGIISTLFGSRATSLASKLPVPVGTTPSTPPVPAVVVLGVNELVFVVELVGMLPVPSRVVGVVEEPAALMPCRRYRVRAVLIVSRHLNEEHAQELSGFQDFTNIFSFFFIVSL